VLSRCRFRCRGAEVVVQRCKGGTKITEAVQSRCRAGAEMLKCRGSAEVTSSQVIIWVKVLRFCRGGAAPEVV